MHDRPMFVTRAGLEKLESELKHLRDVRRPEVAELIRAAKVYSDTMDTADLEEAKKEQGFIEGRINTLEQVISRAQLIEEHHQVHGDVRIGMRVAVLNDKGALEQFTIVGSTEANPRTGKISNESPVGRSLLGRRVGDRVEVAVPAGILHLTVVAIDLAE